MVAVAVVIRPPCMMCWYPDDCVQVLYMRSPSASQKLQPPADEIIILCADEDGPDWEQIEHTVACPLCDYNLRGLNSPRCPECGFVFKWREGLDPTRPKDQYLF